MAFGRLASLLVDIVINTRRVQSQLNQVRGQTQQAAQGMRSALTKIGLAASAFLIVRKAVDLTIDSVWASIKAFAELEKQIVDIQKVARFDNVQEFAQQYIELGNRLRGIVSFKELGEIGGDLARLGIRGGTQGFTDFLEVAAQLKAATGDIDLRQAGEGLGKLLQNFQKPLNAQEALALSSTINKLADDFAVTSNEILTVTQKLSGYANAAGLSAQETLGLVTLIKQTGISSTVVESSITRLLTVLEKTPVTVANALGKSGAEADKFVEKVRVEPIKAIREFFDTLNRMPIDQAVQILADLELATSRNAVALLNATNRMKDWDATQRAAIKGSADVSEFLGKVDQTAETAAANIQHLENTWEQFKTSFASGEGIFGDVLGKLIWLLEQANDKASGLNQALKVLTFSNQFTRSLAFGFLLTPSSATGAPASTAQKALEADQKARYDAAIRAQERQKKLEENSLRVIKETMKNRERFDEIKDSFFGGDNKSRTIRERADSLAKQAKKQFDERQAGTGEIFAAIDILKEIYIQEEMLKKKRMEELEALKKRNQVIETINSLPTFEITSEFQNKLNQLNNAFEKAIQDLDEADLNSEQTAAVLRSRRRAAKKRLIEQTEKQARIGINEFIISAGPGGTREQEIVARALKLQDILSNLPPGKKINPDLLKFLDVPRVTPQFMGLVDAYKKAFTATGEEVQQDQLDALKRLVELQIEDKKLAEETNRLLSKPKAVVK